MKKIFKLLCFLKRKKFDNVIISYNEINFNIIKGIQSNQSEKEFNLQQVDTLSIKSEEDSIAYFDSLDKNSKIFISENDEIAFHEIFLKFKSVKSFE